MFANTTVHRVRPRAWDTARDLLVRVRDAAMAGYPHQLDKANSRLAAATTLLLGAVAYGVMAASGSAVVVTAMLALYFFHTTVWTITVTSLRQALIPHHLLGRVGGASRSFSLLGLLLGSLAGGLIAAGPGLRATLWCGAVVLAGVAVWAFAARARLALPGAEPAAAAPISGA